MNTKRPFFILSLIVTTIVLDTISKLYFSGILHGKTIPLISDFITLYLVHNTGVAFSLPIRGVFLQILTVLLLAFIIFYFIRFEYRKNARLLDIGYALILWGALSHAYERIVYGKVIDFIAVKYFAVLNFADIFISIGVLLLFLYYLFYERHHWKHITSTRK